MSSLKDDVFLEKINLRGCSLSDKRIAKAQIEPFFAALAASINPVPELEFETPLDLLVAVVLSAQCTDKAVNKVTAVLWKECRKAQDYIDLGEEELAVRCRSIGLYRAKSKAIVGLCRQLVAEHGGEVPADREALMRLPGVGRKTANVVLNVAFGQDTLPVDTHVFRVANRTGLAPEKTPEAVELALLPIIPKPYRHAAHHLLLLHGRYVCKARKPECDRCVVSSWCKHFKELGMRN
jgi:endonuclease-3